MNLSAIIPVYNENESITGVIDDLNSSLASCTNTYEIIVVDDGSIDNSSKKVVEQNIAKIISHKKNKGYGASLKTGIRNSKFENILIIDADGTYPTKYIPEMVKVFQDCDMVVASRTGDFVSIPLIRRPAKWFIKKLSEYVTNEKIEDLNSGLRIFKKSDALNYLAILPDKFSFTTTITVAMLSDNLSVEYVKINYLERSGKSKIRALDFINFTNLIIKLSAYFNPLRTFFPIGFLLMLLSFSKFAFDLYYNLYNMGISGFDLLTTKTVSATSILLFISGLQIILFGLMSDALIKRHK